MKRNRLLALFGALTLGATSLALTTDAQAQGTPAEVVGDLEARLVETGALPVIVRTKVAELDALTGVDPATGFDYLPGAYTTTIESVDELNELANTPGIEKIEEDLTGTIQSEDLPVPDGGPLSNASNVDNFISPLHLQGADGSTKAVVIIDSGFDTTASSFGNSFLEEVCFTPGYCGSGKTTGAGPSFQVGAGAASQYPSNYSGYDHGQAVACVAICRNVGNNVTGSAPDAQVIGIRTYFPTPNTTNLGTSLSHTEQALNWVLQNRNNYGIPIKAVNISSGFNMSTVYTSVCGGSTFQSLTQDLADYGISVVAAAGNQDYSDAVVFPACIPEVISVTNHNNGQAVENWAHYSIIDVAVNMGSMGGIYTLASPGVAWYDGTSMGAPTVTGLIASLSEVYPNATPEEMEDAIRTGGDLIRDTGRLNLFAHGGGYSTRKLNGLAVANRLEEFNDHDSGEYNSIQPVRIVETWGGYGSAPITSGSTQTVNLAGLLGQENDVPEHYIAQVTLWGDGCLSVLGNYPQGGPNNGAAGTVSPGGTVSTRQPIVPAVNGYVTFQLYGTCTGTNTLNFAVDIIGYFGNQSDVNTINPVRPINGQVLASGVAGNYAVGGVAGIPANADGVFGMLTVTHAGSGYGFHDAGILADGSAAVMVSSSDGMRNNLVYLDLKSDGSLDIRNVVSPGNATYYLDVFGYTLTSTTDLTIVDATRSYDSRPSNSVSASVARNVATTGTATIPVTAKAVAFNLMAITPTHNPSYYSFVHPSDIPKIVDINAYAGEYRVNTSVIKATCFGSCQDLMTVGLLSPSPGSGHFVVEPMAYMN